VTGTQDGGGRGGRPDVAAVVLKILGVAVSIGLVIGLGAFVLVKALGLDSTSSSGDIPGVVDPITPLPTTALPVPSASSQSTDGPGQAGTPTVPSTGLYLSASPVIVRPMERINLTGQWPGHDNEGLLVQRFEGGKWADFGVHVNVNLGTFETYVMTGHTGDQKFRVVDPQSQSMSNEVTVTVQS
jgi:hypothetical protein